MQLNTSLKRVLVMSALAGFALAIMLLVGFVSGNVRMPSGILAQSDSTSPLANLDVAPEEKLLHFGLPIRLRIPKLDIDVPVELVGLTLNGDMDTPKSPDNVAWFKFGPRPGEAGFSVMAGHLDQKDGSPAVFSDLDKLRQGDKLYVEEENGSTVMFVVKELRVYAWSGDASNVISSSDEGAHLNLITCEGVWDKAQKNYTQRLVVFTDRE